MISDRAFIFHVYIPWGKSPFFSTKVKVIFQGQFQISRSQFSKKNSLFTNTSGFILNMFNDKKTKKKDCTCMSST